MASYEDDHNIRPTGSSSSAPHRPRLDLSSIFENFHTSTSSSESGLHHGTDSDATAFRALAEAFRGQLTESTLIQSLIQNLLEEAEGGKKAEGVPEGFLDGLERVEKKRLKADDACPICNMPFLEDQYPLVVRLPCHTAHLFDLECIAPWLKLHQTCPLDRKVLVKKPPPPVEDSEEEWDDNYA